MKSDRAYFYFKLSFFGALMFMLATFLLCFALFRYAPELHVISQFYTRGVMKSSQQMDVVPFAAEAVEGQNRALIDEMLIRYYLDMRYTVLPDAQEMSRRWRPGSPFSRLTKQEIYRQFIGDDFEKTLKTLPPIVSTVDILSVTPDSKDKNTYVVDFDILGRSSSGQVSLQKKRVILKLGHGKAKNTVTFANPYGTFIDYFSEKNRNS